MTIVVLVGRPAAAATFAVNSALDARDVSAGDGVCATSAGSCTLRAAIEESNALGGADNIVLPGGVYVITLGNGDDRSERGDYDILGAVSISGAGRSVTIVDGNSANRVFDVHEGASLELADLTIRNGDDKGQGGGIRNEASLRLDRVTLTNNFAKDGGGVAVRKDGSIATLVDVVFLKNAASKGGGLHVKDDSTVTVVDSRFSGNAASKDGGGAYFDKNMASIARSLFDANNAEKGGGLFVKGNSASLDIENVTLSGNSASTEGGGLQKEGGGSTRLVNVTLHANRSPRGAGLRGKDGTLSLLNTIVANSLQGADCDGSITSLGHNMDGDGSCQLVQAGDLPATDPDLGPLQDNGGPTLTHALADFSAARDAGANAVCPGADQRGEARPVDGNADGMADCDIGAYEAAPLIPDYDVQKTVVTLSDPVSGPVLPKAIPGAVMQYTISLGNDGPGAADTGSIVISEALPPGTSLVVADFDAANPGPVAFVDGAPACGLSYSFAGLGSAVDDIEFSDDGGATYAYVPAPGADGSDPAVTHVRIRPTGTARYTGADPVAEFLLKVVVR